MEFELNEVQRELHERAQRLLSTSFSSDVVREAEASPDGFPLALWHAAVEAGWPSVALPAAAGGDEHGLLEACVLLEEIGRNGASLPLVTTSGVSATMLSAAPAGPERDRLLKAIAAGAIVSPALIDEHGRNEWDDERLLLESDGDGHRLRGTKILVPFGAAAADLLVTVTSEELGAAIVAVTLGDDAVTVTSHHARTGVPLASVEFADVAIPAERVLHHGDGAVTAKHEALKIGTLLSTAEAIGMCEALISMTATHVTNRMAFGQPIGTFQAVSHPCADMRVSADAVRMLVREAAWLLDNGQPADVQVPAVKGLANEHFERVVNDAYRLHGALGFSNECDVQLFMRRLHGFFASFGETQESYERAAKALGMT